MKLLIISDTHHTFSFPLKNEYDMVILLGDISKEEIKNIDNFYTCPKIGVTGNTDTENHFKGTNIINLHKQMIEINGIRIAGFSGIPKYSYKNQYFEYGDEEVIEFVDRLGKVDIFISHSNPMTDLTKDEKDPYRGFIGLTKYIEEKNPTYLFHGHLHEQKLTKLIDTMVYSIFTYREVEINKG